ncbi:MAG: Glu/Leu/Phe/Val dehydrogenase [Bacillota bacterium]|nr:Glu/Leu/Phe/Val dehydrogenase [Bacillota bacterium]
MRVFERMEAHGYEQVALCHDGTSGLRAIIAIHDTTLGPALGGCRMWNYESEDAALDDALRLARGMTYKSAVAGLNLGGGKSVIIGDPRTQKSEALLRAFGRFVQSLQGRYWTAEDVGTGVEDMEVIRQETDYVAGTAGEGGGGDPSPATAYGVFQGMRACLKEISGQDSLSGRVVALQGVGHVGMSLARLLHQAGARLIVSDIYTDRLDAAVAEFGATAVSADAIFGQECDVFSPCALGAVINPGTIPQLRCKVVAGAANNQLASDADGDALEARGILYAPDYVINAGGVINVADELDGYNRERAYRRIAQIAGNLTRVFALARERSVPSYRAADLVAEERIELIGRIQRTYLPD